MIKFDSLVEAVEYIKKCPLCQERLMFKKDIDIYYHKSRDWELETTLIFTESNMSYSDKLKICLQTGKVERETQVYEEIGAGITGTITQPIWGGSYGMNPSANGHKYLGLGMECPNCRNYNFMIQIVVDLEPCVIANIVLNSESLTFKDKDKTYEIRNIYTTNQTEYMYYNSDAVSEEGTIHLGGRENLPLIPLDRSNPNYFFRRVKNLLLWT
jgi:hypothetical protein